MEREAQSSPSARPDGPLVQPVVRRVRVPGPATMGSDGMGGPGAAGTAAGGGRPASAGHRGWYRDRRAQFAAAVLAGVVVGALPGLTMALTARLESRTAEKRAAAAEDAVRLWQEQANVDASPTPGGATSTGGVVRTGDGATPTPTTPERTAGPEARNRRLPGDGVFRVGKDVQPGVWESKGNSGCHWERLRETRSNGQVVAGYGNPVGTATVTIRSTDDMFKTNGCKDWSKIG